VIGGGVIGLELGSVWKRLGAKVTVVEYLDQILPGMDGEVRADATKIFKKQGFEIRTSTKVTKVERNGSGATSRSSPPPAAPPRRSRPTWCWSRSAAAPTPTASRSSAPACRSTIAA
jgi:NADPH-dependent 2,4-dienoyl-CoA reductase/sulfur reductase-like enzyme